MWWRGVETIQEAYFSAVNNVTDGRLSFLNLLECLHIEPGHLLENRPPATICLSSKILQHLWTIKTQEVHY